MPPPRTLADPAGRGEVDLLVTAADSGGRRLLTRSRLRPGFPRPPLHVHPRQSERFTVVRGRVEVRIGRSRRLLAPGETLTVPPGVAHTFTVAGGAPLELLVEFRPAGDMEGFLRGLTALAAAGALRAGGRPRWRAGARLAAAHRADFRLARLPDAVQRLTIGLLARPTPRGRPRPRRVSAAGLRAAPAAARRACGPR